MYKPLHSEVLLLFSASSVSFLERGVVESIGVELLLHQSLRQQQHPSNGATIVDTVGL
jgi:hypothetical protein